MSDATVCVEDPKESVVFDIRIEVETGGRQQDPLPLLRRQRAEERDCSSQSFSGERRGLGEHEARLAPTSLRSYCGTRRSVDRVRSSQALGQRCSMLVAPVSAGDSSNTQGFRRRLHVRRSITPGAPSRKSVRSGKWSAREKRRMPR